MRVLRALRKTRNCRVRHLELQDRFIDKHRLHRITLGIRTTG